MNQFLQKEALHSLSRISVQKEGFSFMKKVANLCRSLTSDEVQNYGNRAGKVYFAEEGEKVRMLNRSEANPKIHTGIRVENILRRTDMNFPGWPKFEASATVEHITMRWPKQFDDSYYLWAIETTSRFGNIRSWLADRKKEFSSNHVVESVEQLEALDVIFVHFEWDGQLYSITVAEPSKEIDGKHFALCNVIYRVKDERGRYREKEAHGIMTLPLKTGGKMRFVEWGVQMIKELSLHKIVKLQHKSLKSSQSVH